ncbi:DUF6207 family protein [Streptomyces luteogriseus]|uniref:DUF6207 family protein n=1 Tax=Streptomyces luteogriseus TaxID=68233 RepID=UPI0037A351B8
MSEDFFGVSQVSLHPLEFSFELLHPHHRGLPPRFQNRPHRRHPPPPRQLDQQRVEAFVARAIPCLTSGIRTRGLERERPLRHPHGEWSSSWCVADRTTRALGKPGARLRCYLDVRQNFNS